MIRALFSDGTLCLSSNNICSIRSTTPGETKLLASEIYELLQASSHDESQAAEEPVSSRRKAQFFLGSSNKRAKTVVLHIEGLDDPVGDDRTHLLTFSLHEVKECGFVAFGRVGEVCVRRRC